MLPLCGSNVVLIWYRCINLLWHQRYWNILAQRSMWEELSRSAETSSMIQKKSVPRKQPTSQRATTLSRLPKLVVWEKCWRSIIESKWHIPDIWITRENKSHINCKCQQSKVWLIFLNCFLSRDHFLQFFNGKKNTFKRRLHHTRNSLFRLATDIPNKPTLKIKLSSQNTQTFFFLPYHQLANIKGSSHF